MDKNEFLEFMNSDKQTRIIADDQVLTTIKDDLYPGNFYVLTKFILIQFVAALMTLSICPQFGIGLFGGHHGVLHYVMSYGEIVCGLFCGSLFVGVSCVVSLLFLNREQLRGIYRKKMWLIPSISFFYLSSLMITGTSLETNMMSSSVSFMLLWVIGGVLTSFAGTQILFRQRLS